MPYRGNGATPPYAVSTGPHFIDPTTAYHGERIARLETRVDGIEEDQEADRSLLTQLREEFAAHVSRPVSTIIRQRWDEIAPYLIAAVAVSYSNRELMTQWAYWVLGISPG